MSEPRILLVGCGNMGGAMLRGWLAHESGLAVTVITPHPERLPRGVAAHASIEAYDGADPDVVVLAVKPQKLEDVSAALERVVGRGTIVLSVLAAVDGDTLRRRFPRAAAIVRAVPNLPASVGIGATALAGDLRGAADRALITRLCAAFGTVEWLASERALDAATSVSGCGPAFLFRFADAVVQAGIAQGLESQQARRLFAQTMLGAGRMLADGGSSPGEMADAVASPGGVTLAGLAVLDAGDALRTLVAATLAAAAARNTEMAEAARDQP